MAARCPAYHRPAVRFRLGASNASELCLRHGVAHGPLVRTAAVTALVVGSVLTLINQGNALLGGDLPSALAWKIPLTYAVPYMVSTWSALRISRVHPGHGTTRAESGLS